MRREHEEEEMARKVVKVLGGLCDSYLEETRGEQTLSKVSVSFLLSSLLFLLTCILVILAGSSSLSVFPSDRHGTDQSRFIMALSLLRSFLRFS